MITTNASLEDGRGKCKNCKKEVKAIQVIEYEPGTYWTCDTCKSTFIHIEEETEAWPKMTSMEVDDLLRKLRKIDID